MAFSIISFSKTLKYKILLWALVVIGGLVFLMGAVFILTDTSANTVKVTNLHLSASGISVDMSQTTYRLKVYKNNTPVQVFTSPGNNTGKPVTFTLISGSTHIMEKPANVFPGEYTTLKLKTNSGNNYFYGEETELLVECSGIQKRLVVTICVPEEKADFIYELTNTVAENTLSASGYSSHRFTPSLYIDNIKIDNNSVFWKAVSLKTEYGVILVNSNGKVLSSIFIPEELLLMVANKQEAFIINFLITATYLYKDYIDIFELTVVP